MEQSTEKTTEEIQVIETPHTSSHEKQYSEELIQEMRLLETIHIISNVMSGWFFGTIVVGGYLLLKKDISAEIKTICYDILNFNISFILYTIVGAIAIVILIWLVLLPIIYITWVILLIIGAVNHFHGKRYSYPMTIKFFK